MFAKPVSYGPSSAANPNEDRRYGGAFGVSAMLHGILVGLLVLTTIALREDAAKEPKAIQIVAGPGNDYMASEAPSGSEQGKATQGEIQFTSPTEVPTWNPPAPDSVAESAPPEPTPPQVTKVEPVPVEPVKPVKTELKTPPVPNFTRQINRKLANEKAKVDKQIQKQREQDARAAKERELASKRLSYDEFSKSNGSKSASTSKVAGGGTGAPGPRIDANGIKRGVTGGTGAGSQGAGGTALTAAEGDRMERYFAMLTARLRESHEKPGGLSDLLSAEVQFTLAANGVISGVRIVRSSGNDDFDQSVLEAFARVKMPARPDGKTDTIKLVFRMKEIDSAR